MKFKDIVNRNQVDISTCEQELIHIPGTIQGFGFLLALAPDTLVIDYCSANSFEYTGFGYEQLLGKPFELIAGSSQGALIKEIMVSGIEPERPVELEINNRVFVTTVQKLSNCYLLELELRSGDHYGVSDIYQQTMQVTNYLQKAGSLQMLCESVAHETRKVTGFDRVMIYRFDEAYNGEVYAESRNGHVEPFLGLHYPHTDIPSQARDLYLKNLVRIIADVNAVPVPLYTIDNGVNQQLDLSLSTLRSVSPIHIQYLKNMGVAASFSISLVYEGRLWGLIACHHYSPRYLSHDTRLAAQLQGHFLTSQIGVRLVAEEYSIAKNVNRSLDHLLAQALGKEQINPGAVINEAALLTLTNASCVIFIIDDIIYSKGPVPADEVIKKLANALHAIDNQTGFNTYHLSAYFPEAHKWCHLISGVIFHSLGTATNDCIIWGRPEMLQEVNWAGDPKHAVIKTEKSLSPRKSFEIWKEIKHCHSSKWQQPELIAASSFTNAFQKHVHMLFLSREELKQRMLNNKLMEANAELENMYWIGSHDLKEPLRKIQVFASRIIDQDFQGDYAKLVKSVVRMNDSANRMQLLISDILSYSSLNNVEENASILDLGALVKSVMEDLSPELEQYNAVVEYSDLPLVKGTALFLEQLLVNLLQNSLKFSRPGLPPRITFTYSGLVENPAAEPSATMYHQIVVRDNGIGFDNTFNESIFQVFTRLHTQNEYNGSGIGLALCRKIMKNHNGFISALGEPGQGTSIYLLFPEF